MYLSHPAGTGHAVGTGKKRTAVPDTVTSVGPVAIDILSGTMMEGRVMCVAERQKRTLVVWWKNMTEWQSRSKTRSEYLPWWVSGKVWLV